MLTVRVSPPGGRIKPVNPNDLKQIAPRVKQGSGIPAQSIKWSQCDWLRVLERTEDFLVMFNVATEPLLYPCAGLFP